MMCIELEFDNNWYKEYYVHNFHECDLYNYLKNYKNKIEISKKETTKSLKNEYKLLTEYFKIKPTLKDINYILTTAWFKNTEHNNKKLEKELMTCKKIKILLIEYQEE